jgi:hypothetical protein
MKVELLSTLLACPGDLFFTWLKLVAPPPRAKRLQWQTTGKLIVACNFVFDFLLSRLNTEDYESAGTNWEYGSCNLRVCRSCVRKGKEQPVWQCDKHIFILNHFNPWYYRRFKAILTFEILPQKCQRTKENLKRKTSRNSRSHAILHSNPRGNSAFLTITFNAFLNVLTRKQNRQDTFILFGREDESAVLVILLNFLFIGGFAFKNWLFTYEQNFAKCVSV